MSPCFFTPNPCFHVGNKHGYFVHRVCLIDYIDCRVRCLVPIVAFVRLLHIFLNKALAKQRQWITWQSATCRAEKTFVGATCYCSSPGQISSWTSCCGRTDEQEDTEASLTMRFKRKLSKKWVSVLFKITADLREEGIWTDSISPAFVTKNWCVIF